MCFHFQLLYLSFSNIKLFSLSYYTFLNYRIHSRHGNISFGIYHYCDKLLLIEQKNYINGNNT